MAIRRVNMVKSEYGALVHGNILHGEVDLVPRVLFENTQFFKDNLF